MRFQINKRSYPRIDHINDLFVPVHTGRFYLCPRIVNICGWDPSTPKFRIHSMDDTHKRLSHQVYREELSSQCRSPFIPPATSLISSRRDVFCVAISKFCPAMMVGAKDVHQHSKETQEIEIVQEDRTVEKDSFSWDSCKNTKTLQYHIRSLTRYCSVVQNMRYGLPPAFWILAATRPPQSDRY